MDVYTDPLHAGSFRRLGSIQRHTKVDLDTARKWLMGEKSYTLHKQSRLKFRRRRTIAKGINELWQADLVDLSLLSNENNAYRYLLTCIDVFSKFARVERLKNKSGLALTAAFTKMIATHQCKLLQTDKGTEFLNGTFQKLLKDRNIRHYTSENEDIKASVVERFNRTLKGVMWRYLTYKSSGRYIDVLQHFVSSYNNTYHRSIKMAPSQVNAQNESVVRKVLYPPQKLQIKWRYQVGQSVRIKESKRVFKKGYEPSWTEEIFTIASLFPSDPPTYILKDLSGEEIKEKNYEQDIQPITQKADETYVVERVIKTRRRGKNTDYFVKWRNYPDKFNSWIYNIAPING